MGSRRSDRRDRHDQRQRCHGQPRNPDDHRPQRRGSVPRRPLPVRARRWRRNRQLRKPDADPHDPQRQRGRRARCQRRPRRRHLERGSRHAHARELRVTGNAVDGRNTERPLRDRRRRPHPGRRRPHDHEQLRQRQHRQPLAAFSRRASSMLANGGGIHVGDDSDSHDRQHRIDGNSVIVDDPAASRRGFDAGIDRRRELARPAQQHR